MKLDDATVGRRYGKAIFELASEENQLDSVYKELIEIQDVFLNIPDLGEILSDVRLASQKKQKILAGLTEGTSRIVCNFLSVVYDYNRMYDILFMIQDFEVRYYRLKSIVKGTVTTAIPLSEEQKTKVEMAFAKKIGCKQAYLENIIDTSIIGGVIIESNNKKIDGSIQKQLDNFKKTLVN